MNSSSESYLDRGSFRDRDGRVYILDGRVYRGISEDALASFRVLTKKKFYQRHCKAGSIVASRELEAHEVPPQALANDSYWAGFLEHQAIPVVSYPYEWTFGMLQAAAMLQLELQESALKAGLTMKDATPYNIQFVAGKPVFIDLLSFEPLEEGAPWSGYRQFCELFLYPLLFQAYKGVDFQPFLKGRIDGIRPSEANAMFSFRDRFRKGVFGHVYLQSVMDKKYANTQQNVRGNLKGAGFNKELILVNIRKLKKLVSSLSWSGQNSEWGAYEQFHNYSDDDHQAKEAFVVQSAKTSQPDVLWDIGCNTGQFSRAVGKYVGQILAMDGDHFAVERLYQNLDRDNILPMVQNLSDPSPNWGWRGRERSDLGHRAKPDLILCLALIHHLVISANIPVAELIDWLASFQSDLVIEFVSKDDDKVKTLLRNKQDKYHDYELPAFEACLQKHYQVINKLALSSGNRFLYYLEIR